MLFWTKLRKNIILRSEILDLDLQDQDMLKSDKVPLEETLIVSLGLLAGRERKLETGVAALTAQLTSEVVDELVEEVAMGIVGKYKAAQNVASLVEEGSHPQHPVPSAPPRNLFSDESD